MHILVLCYGGGLGNRLNMILSAISFHLKYNSFVEIIWFHDQSFQCDIEDLFEINHPSISCKSIHCPVPTVDFFDFTPYKNCLFIIRDINHTLLKSVWNIGTPFSTSQFVLDPPYSVYSLSEGIVDKDLLPKILFPDCIFKDIDTLVFTDPNILAYPDNIQETLDFFIKVFIPKCLPTIVDFFEKYTPNSAVHIRLTDKKIQAGYSDNQLEEDIHSIFPNLVNNTVFICSDDLTVETTLIHRYKYCIHYPKKNTLCMENDKISRSKESCLEALIDFYIFCGCANKIGINSTIYTSTFFQVAALFQESFCKHFLIQQQNNS